MPCLGLGEKHEFKNTAGSPLEFMIFGIARDLNAKRAYVFARRNIRSCRWQAIGVLTTEEMASDRIRGKRKAQRFGLPAVWVKADNPCG